ncbi:MAG: hypothetical protein ABI647_21225 [Gemmatimonadota bacterium]
MSPRALLSLLLVLAACDPPRAAVRLSIPGLDGAETLLPGIVLTFLPYNRDSVITALEARAKPRPNTEALDSLFRAFRGPFTALVLATRDHDVLQSRLDSLRRLPAAPGQVKAVAAVHDSLRSLASRLAQARGAVDTARRALWPTMDSLRGEYKAWERIAHRGYDSIVKRYLGTQFVNTVSDTTGTDGWAVIDLTNGDWWVTARAIDPKDPNAEWYWNVPITRDTIFLNPRNGHNRPRY